MTAEGEEREEEPRPLLRRTGVLVTLTLLATCLAVLVPVVLTPSSSTTFSINADTGVVEVRPLCADKIVWDLPEGEAEARSCVPDAAALTDPAAWRKACSVGPAPVTVTLLAGATAKIEVEGPDRWAVTFGATAVEGCSIRDPAPVQISVGDRQLPHDPQGYFYRPAPSDEPEGFGAVVAAVTRASANAPNLTLALTGRVVIGQAMQFGAGWRAAPAPTLYGAKLVARDRALLTGEPLTIIDEEVEPGTIIDTHAEFQAALVGPAGGADSIERADGFVQLFDDRLGVQVYQPLSVGLLPLASNARIVKVLRWRPLWAAPVVQLGAGLVVLLAGILGLVFSFHEAAGLRLKLF